jgi:hypothetical protein
MVTSHEMLEDRLARLGRQIRVLEILLAAGGAALVVTACLAGRMNRQSAGIIRARGLVIEDGQGRPRILLGAPVAAVEGRKRRDPATGMVVLDEKGMDRLAVGSPATDPASQGKVLARISPETGVTVSDGEGTERVGLGVLENGRVVLGMDYPDGNEAVSLFILPDSGYSGLTVDARSGKNRQRIFLGASQEAGDPGALLIDDEAGGRLGLQVVKGRPSLSFVAGGGGGSPEDLLAGKGRSSASVGSRPHFGDLMVEVGRRFETIGKTAKAGRWDLALYELGELQEAFEALPKAEPPEKTEGVNLVGLSQAFLNTHPPEIKVALTAHDLRQLGQAFANAAETCNGCHKAAGRAFIQVPGEPGAAVPKVDPSP